MVLITLNSQISNYIAYNLMVKKISYTLISILFLFSIVLNIVCVVYVYTTHTREYNEMGIFFDGINTYDTDSVFASRIFLIASFSISLILLWVLKNHEKWIFV